MAALDQYLDLYRRQREAFDAHSCEALNALRHKAAEALADAGRLPVKSDEGYEKTSVEEMFAPDFGVNVNRVNFPVNVADSFRCDVPNLSTLLGVVINDRFLATDMLRRNLPEGVTVCSLNQADPALLKRLLAGADESAAAAFNAMLLQDGVYIHVAKGVHLDKPIQLVDIFSGATPLLAARRVVLVADDDARVSVLKCDHTQSADVDFASTEVVQIFAGRDACVEWYDLEESTLRTHRWCRFIARQAAGSRLNICAATLTNGSTRNEYSITAEGPGCLTQLSGMAIGSATQHIDNSSYMLHGYDHSQSDQLFKYVLDDHATGAFEGLIKVAHGARFNEAYQNNRNLLASDGARMHTKPQLLIYNDDVKCSHGAATGQLDASALFYMRSRGIPMAEARKMLMQAFMVDVVERIKLESLRDRLRHLLELRFSGSCADAACATCRKQ